MRPARVHAAPRESTQAPSAAPRLRAVDAGASEPAGLVALRLEALDEERRVATVVAGRESVEAELDGAVDTAVIRTALARGERVIAQREGDGWIVLGVLRTVATPGVDRGDEYVVEARRVKIAADHEFAVVSGGASFVVRAIGAIEALAADITSRASGVNKVIGRMIRLN